MTSRTATMSEGEKIIPATKDIMDRLTIFTFLWAAQAIVHQEFRQTWVFSSPVLGWTLIILAWTTLLWPRSLGLFTAMLTTSIIFNVIEWPDVFNHILVESVINFTILLAIASVWIPWRRLNKPIDTTARNAMFDRFAPVVGVMLILVYYFAFIAKLNTDFFNPVISCAKVLYGDLVRVFPFMPDADWTNFPVIWGTILVELAIPVLLTFRRTRYAAILIGLGFHFMLGLIGHRTFSALAYALYSLYCIEPVTGFVNYLIQRLEARLGLETIKKYLQVARVGAILVGILFALELMGIYPPRGLSFARIDWVFWLSWSALVALIYGGAIILNWLGKIQFPRLERVTWPGLLWLMVLLVILNGMSQYIGLKTKTSFTMYSNLQTEGGRNNHLFMPAWRVANYQDDLVEIVETDNPELHEYIDQNQYLTYFEFRRLVNEARNQNFHVTYFRGETPYEFDSGAGVSTDAELSKEHPLWLAKLLYFRPIAKGEAMLCLH